jgi:hypothetical protein
MRKLFSNLVIAMLFLISGNIFAQGAVDIQLSATDGITTNNQLRVGLDLTATTNIDPSLGESDLPPFPPSGVFEARFDLSPFGVGSLSTYQDYRNAPAFPYSGTVEHRIIWQLGTGATSFSIGYNLPAEATMVIQDIITGTIVNSGTLSGTGSYQITFPITAAKITMTYTNIGSVPAPIFGVSPSSLNFGNVNVGSSSTLPVTVNNTGTLPLDISNIVSSNAQFTFSPSTFPISVAAGGSQVINVTFTPTANGNQSGNLSFTHNAAGSPSSYSVQGVGYTPAPIFGVSPASLNFGSVSVGGSANLPVTIHNTGDAPLNLSGITSTNAQFTFSPNTFPISIPASGSQVVTVTFAPTAAGSVSANLTFTHDAAGSPTSYSVQGIGFTTAPVFNFSVPSLNFGNVSVGGTATLPITISNTGNAQLTISNIVSSNGVFTFAPSTFPVNIAAGGSSLFNVTFTPAVAGAVSGNLTFTHNAAGSPSDLPLQGTGQTQGGLLKFVVPSRDLLDGTENNPDAIVLSGYTGQPMKALQFDLVVGHSNGRLILRSVERGSAIPTPQFNFSYEIYPGPTLPDGSSKDRVKVVIVGNGTNSIMPAVGDQEILKFAYDVVDITGPSATTTNHLENVLGATATPVIDANISTGTDENINIYNGVIGAGLLGDVNLDDNVNILDILLMIDHILGRVTLTGLAFTQGDIAPWTVGAPLPIPDGTINVLDLSVLQNIVLTGLYPNGDPINKALVNPFTVNNNSVSKITPGMDAKLTFYLTDSGIAVEIESIKKVKGVQMELNELRSLIPQGSVMASIFDQAMYYQNNSFLRMLSYDGSALPVDPGQFVIANIPFNLYNPQSIVVENIIVADEDNKAMEKVEIEIKYEGAPGLPLDYSLSQNFPNPFNPTTSVQFSVPKEGFVTIRVYDMLGQEVATLYSGNALAGTHTLNWDGKDNSGNVMSSGNYIYRMTAGEFVQSKKMSYLK